MNTNPDKTQDTSLDAFLQTPMTQSEVAVARVLAAFSAWGNSNPDEARSLAGVRMQQVWELLHNWGLVSGTELSDEGILLIVRARRTGVSLGPAFQTTPSPPSAPEDAPAIKAIGERLRVIAGNIKRPAT